MDKPRTRREREIWQACDDLYAMNMPFSKITGDAIRDQLVELGYRRGSPNEVYKYRKSWQEARGIEISEIKEEEGSHFSEPISRAVILVRESIQTEAKATIDEIKKETAEQVKAAQEQTEQSRQTYEVLQKEYNSFLTEHTQLKKDYQGLNENYLIAEERRTQAEQQVNIHQALLTKTENEYENRLNELNAAHQQTIDTLKAKFIHYEEVSKKTIDDLKTIQEKQYQQHIAEMDKLKVQQQRLEKQIEDMRLAEQRIQLLNEELKTYNRRIESELEKSKHENQTTLQKFHQAEKSLSEYQGKYTQLSLLADDRQKQLEKTQLGLILSHEKIGRLEAEIIHLKAHDEKNT